MLRWTGGVKVRADLHGFGAASYRSAAYVEASNSVPLLPSSTPLHYTEIAKNPSLQEPAESFAKQPNKPDERPPSTQREDEVVADTATPSTHSFMLESRPLLAGIASYFSRCVVPKTVGAAESEDPLDETGGAESAAGAPSQTTQKEASLKASSDPPASPREREESVPKDGGEDAAPSCPSVHSMPTVVEEEDLTAELDRGVVHEVCQPLIPARGSLDRTRPPSHPSMLSPDSMALYWVGKRMRDEPRLFVPERRYEGRRYTEDRRGLGGTESSEWVSREMHGRESMRSCFYAGPATSYPPPPPSPTALPFYSHAHYATAASSAYSPPYSSRYDREGGERFHIRGGEVSSFAPPAPWELPIGAEPWLSHGSGFMCWESGGFEGRAVQTLPYGFPTEPSQGLPLIEEVDSFDLEAADGRVGSPSHSDFFSPRGGRDRSSSCSRRGAMVDYRYCDPREMTASGWSGIPCRERRYCMLASPFFQEDEAANYLPSHQMPPFAYSSMMSGAGAMAVHPWERAQRPSGGSVELRWHRPFTAFQERCGYPAGRGRKSSRR